MHLFTLAYYFPQRIIHPHWSSKKSVVSFAPRFDRELPEGDFSFADKQVCAPMAQRCSHGSFPAMIRLVRCLWKLCWRDYHLLALQLYELISTSGKVSLGRFFLSSCAISQLFHVRMSACVYNRIFHIVKMGYREQKM